MIYGPEVKKVKFGVTECIIHDMLSIFADSSQVRHFFASARCRMGFKHHQLIDTGNINTILMGQHVHKNNVKVLSWL